MLPFFTLRAGVMGELSRDLPLNFALLAEGRMVCWCFQKLSDDLPVFVDLLKDAISTEARTRRNAGESGDRYSAEAWHTILSGFLAGMAGLRPFTPPTIETVLSVGGPITGAQPALPIVNAPTTAHGQGVVAPGFGGLVAGAASGICVVYERFCPCAAAAAAAAAAASVHCLGFAVAVASLWALDAKCPSALRSRQGGSEFSTTPDTSYATRNCRESRCWLGLECIW